MKNSACVLRLEVLKKEGKNDLHLKYPPFSKDQSAIPFSFVRLLSHARMQLRMAPIIKSLESRWERAKVLNRD